jgi:hypothetical protein
MKQFINRTSSGKENATKIGTTVPPDAAGISYFSNEVLSPKNNLNIIDISQSIPENKMPSFNGSKLFFANELGILEDENGNTNFGSSDISVSDTILDKEYLTKQYNPFDLEPTAFFHSYYVSRFFISAPSGYSIMDLSEVFNPKIMNSLNIKVVDAKNQEYIDPNTGRKKYKILLDPFITTQNSQDSEYPHKIIVGLDATDSFGLKLIYDKIDCDEDGKVLTQSLRYTETINSVPYFKLSPEESFVVDNSYRKKIFAIKKFNKKYSDIISKNFDSSGYQVYVPKKALGDNRTFEVFNWRIIARTRQSLNLEIIDYFDDIENTTNIKQKIVNACVLYDSTDTVSLENIKPYIFYRLENSPFNFSKFTFINNMSEQIGGIPKNSSKYWIVDSQSVNTLENFDVVAFAPTKTLSQKTLALISNYVKNQNGTLIVDGFLYPSGSPFVFPDISISELSTTVAPTHYNYQTSSKILDETKNGGWNIDQSIFENQDYGIFGLKKTAYRYLNNIVSSKSILNIGTSPSNAAPVAALFEFPSPGDALSKGNIIFTTFGFFEYCNSIYSIAGKSTVINANNASTSFEEAEPNLVSAVVEGPFKFLYNSVSYALYSRAYATTSIDTRSSLFNFVGQWNSSWVLYQDALLDEEKEKYFVNISNSANEIKYARDLIPESISIGDFYLKLLYNNLPTYHRDKISYINMDDIKFYIEVTNPDVLINKATTFSGIFEENTSENIPTSYYLFKFNGTNKEKIYAYTQTFSPSLNIPDGFGPYYVKQISGIKSSETKTINNSISPVNYFKSYPFELATRYSYQTATDKPMQFNGKINSNITIAYKGTGQLRLQKLAGSLVRTYYTTSTRTVTASKKPPTVVAVPRNQPIPGSEQPIPGPEQTLPCVQIKSGIDSVFDSISGFQWRNFDYTWDIDSSPPNSFALYKVGSSGDYVKYIQCILKAGNFYGSSIDGSFGPITEAAVKEFQEYMKGQKNKVFGENGTVDSETKALFKTAYDLNLKGIQKKAPDLCTQNGVKRFLNSAERQKNINQINSGGEYRRISQSDSGPSGVKKIQDIIFFEIPSVAQTVKRVTVNFGALENWRKVLVESYGFSNVDHTATIKNIEEVFPKYNVRQPKTKEPDASGNVVLDIDQPIRNAKYFYIHVRTKDEEINPNKYGSAEGYQISRIQCDIVGSSTSPAPSSPTGPAGPSDTEVRIEQVVTTSTQKFLVFPSFSKPELEDQAKYLVEDIKGLFWGSNGQLQYAYNSAFYIYIHDRENYYVWNGDSWNQLAVGEAPMPAIGAELLIKEKVVTKDVTAYVSASTVQNFTQLSAASSITKVFDTTTVKSINPTFSTINFFYINKTYNENLTPADHNLKTKKYTSPSGAVFDFTKPIYVELNGLNSVSFSEVVSETGATVSSPSNFISISYGETNAVSGNPISATITTSATVYSGSSVVITELSEVTDYFMRNLDNKIIPKKESITSVDGVLLLCQANGKSIGIPSGSEIKSYFGTSASEQEKDARLGFVSVINLLASEKNSDGFIFGFYDLIEKEFLGTQVSFVDMLARGINNIFLAVGAYDADGNTHNLIDYIGPKVSLTFVPVDVPIKKVMPIYSVRYVSESAIKIGFMNFEIDKKEAWPLTITSGSFTKIIKIPSGYYFNDWKKNYIGQPLIATYDTSSAKGVNWSNVFGRGYYDIKNEKPIIVSDKQIKVKQPPILVWNEPTNYSISKTTLIKPQFDVYTRQDKNSPWTKVDFAEIRDFDSKSGIIQFNSRIVPEDDELIKITYVRKSSDLVVYQSNGNPVPLNPFLNSEIIKFNKALYIYLLPSKVAKTINWISLSRPSSLSSYATSYIPISEYSQDYAYNFTYDSNIFSELSTKYDPFALPIGIIYYTNNPNKFNTTLYDTRLRGGGVKTSFELKDLEKDFPNINSHWDIYPIHGETYPKGGYVIIRIPEEVKQNFLGVEEIYDIVRSNLTAGISFEIQNMDGEPWEI